MNFKILLENYLSYIYLVGRMSFSYLCFRGITFGQKESSHYLLSYSADRLIVWNLGKLQMEWQLEVRVMYISPDPSSKHVAVFIHRDKKKSKHNKGIQYFILEMGDIFVDSLFNVICSSDISKNDYKILFFDKNYSFSLSVFLRQRKY